MVKNGNEIIFFNILKKIEKIFQKRIVFVINVLYNEISSKTYEKLPYMNLGLHVQMFIGEKEEGT